MPWLKPSNCIASAVSNLPAKGTNPDDDPFLKKLKRRAIDGHSGQDPDAETALPIRERVTAAWAYAWRIARATEDDRPRWDARALTPWTTLPDDRNFFPEYAAVSFFRDKLPAKARQSLAKLNGLISEKAMQDMNALALFDKQDFGTIAHAFLQRNGLPPANR